MTTSAIPAPPVQPREKHLELELLGKRVNLVIDGRGARPKLIEVNERGIVRHKQPTFAIDILPSRIDPRYLIARWPQKENLSYVLLILNREGELLFQGEPTKAGMVQIPILAVETYIGESLQAVLIWLNREERSEGFEASQWFQVPGPAPKFVWAYDDGRERWVRRRKSRFTRTNLELTLIAILLGMTFAGLYYLAYRYR